MTILLDTERILLLQVRDDAGNVGWGTVLNFKKQEAAKQDGKQEAGAELVQKQYMVDVLVNSLNGMPCLPGAAGSEVAVLSVPLTHLDGISQVQL